MNSLLRTARNPPKSLVRIPCRWRHTTKAKRKPPSSSSPPPKPPPNIADVDARSVRHGLTGETMPNLGQKRPEFMVQRNYQMFQSLVQSRFINALEEMGPLAENKDEYQSFGITNQAQLDKEVALFKTILDKAFTLAMEQGKTGRQENPLFWNLRNAFIRYDAHGLRRELKYAFQTFLMRSRFPKAVNELHMATADLRFPYEWYPATRTMQRTIHLHVGPTNSGKTYNALKALESAKTGIYAGPLRLLAHEIWNRFSAKKKPCALITGEELRIPEDSDTWFHSCTVEMAPVNAKVDVAVIDEIQMIANEERGWAWTQAFLGLQAKELHLCGEERVVDLIQDMCARLGEKCIVHRYQRLNPLKCMDKSLHGSFKGLQKGDAVIAFSRVSLHQLKAGIEKETGRRCAIVYGSLPPETRVSQAALFNDPNNDYDYLVASDAIGMGLNLEIKRVIFESSTKFDGVMMRTLTVPEIKQIGGRAGRYRTANQAITGNDSEPTIGLVTALENEDLYNIQKSFATEVGPIKTAGLFPPASVIERFHSYFPPRTPISFVLARLREMARFSSRFHMCDFTNAMQIAELLKPYDLSVSDRCVFLSVPINLRDGDQINALQAFAKCVAEMGSGHLLDFSEINLEILEKERPREADEQITRLHRLESLHQTITMYLWLSYRYQGVFQSQQLAFKVKEMVEEKIADLLENLNFAPEMQRSRRARNRLLAARKEEQERSLLGPEEEEGDLLVSPEEEDVGSWNEEGHGEPLFEGPEDDAGVAVEGGVLGERERTGGRAGVAGSG